MAIAVTLVAELALTWICWRASVSAGHLARQRRLEIRALAGEKSPRKPADRQGLGQQLSETVARLARWEARFADPDASAAVNSAKAAGASPRTDAFFELEEFVRMMRERARIAGADVAAGETFGFAADAVDGTRPADLARLRRQCRVAGRLLQALWAARPRQFIALERRDASRAAKTGRGAASRGSAVGLQAVDCPAGTDVPPGFEVDAFRLTFAGKTTSLRGFLNALAADKWPLVVRSITAQPATASRRAAPTKRDEPLAQLVKPGPARFTVVVEAYVLPKVTATGRGDHLAVGAAGATPPGPAPAWTAPVASSASGGRRYELFTPPSIYFERTSGRLVWMDGTDSAPGTGSAAGLELLGVRPGPFRWQLAGYALGTDGLYGVFLDTVAGRTEVLGRGSRLDGGYSVVELTVAPAGTGADASGAGEGAEATVVDESTGARIVISSRHPCLAGPPLGLFACRGQPDFRRELREGESVAIDGSSYCVERLELTPARAVVARSAANAVRPEIVTLVPRADRQPGSTGPGPRPNPDK